MKDWFQIVRFYCCDHRVFGCRDRLRYWPTKQKREVDLVITRTFGEQKVRLVGLRHLVGELENV